MAGMNRRYEETVGLSLFGQIEERAKRYKEAHPTQKLFFMGIGELSQPLCEAAVTAMKKAADDQARVDAGVVQASKPRKSSIAVRAAKGLAEGAEHIVIQALVAAEHRFLNALLRHGHHLGE